MRQRQTGQADKLGIYIHIPFCRSKCDYCDFYSLAGREDRMDAYQKALLAHIRETAPLAQGIPVDTVYFGGGTPSWYGARRIQELLSAYGEKTGVAPAEGCDLSARLYACAAQVFSLYVQAGWVARQAFPLTAEGEDLDRRAQLRGLANTMDTILHIGKDGIGENLVKQADDALEARELIKGKVLENNIEYDARLAAQELAKATRSEVVQVIGTKFVLYRESHSKPKEKRIQLVKSVGKRKA